MHYAKFQNPTRGLTKQLSMRLTRTCTHNSLLDDQAVDGCCFLETLQLYKDTSKHHLLLCLNQHDLIELTCRLVRASVE